MSGKRDYVGDAPSKARLATPDSLNKSRKSVLSNMPNAQNLTADGQEKKRLTDSSQMGSNSHP